MGVFQADVAAKNFGEAFAITGVAIKKTIRKPRVFIKARKKFFSSSITIFILLPHYIIRNICVT
jgi:hypothetical protein